MHAGLHNSNPSLAAATTAVRRLSVFKKTLHSAANCVSPTLNPEFVKPAAAHKAAMFLDFAEFDRYRSVLKASARGRRVS